MSKTMEEIREKARRDNAACRRLEDAGYLCWGDWAGLVRRGICRVIIEWYEAGKNTATNFPDKRWYFKDFEEASAFLLDGRGDGSAE